MKPLVMIAAAAWASVGICVAQQIERTFERTINLAGPASLDLTTDSGGIEARHIESEVRAVADSGGATLTLASAAGYDLRARTDSGRIAVPEMTVSGNLSPRQAEGKVRAGGPLVDVQVSSGNIDIRQIRQCVME